MTRDRVIRSIRIGLSTIPAVLCFAALVLWLRSYRWEDWTSGKLMNQAHISIRSDLDSGLVTHVRIDKTLPKSNDDWKWNFVRHKGRTYSYHPTALWVSVSDSRLELQAPYVYLASLLGIIALLPWASLRFSLRNGLVATTIASLMLGWTIYLMRISAPHPFIST